MRSFQGLLLLGVAIFSLKWEFAQPVNWGIETLPPMKSWMWLSQAAVLTALAAYLLATGEMAYWKRQPDRYSGDTFLAQASCFLAVFLNKFAYASRAGDPWGVYPAYTGYFPPFNEERIFLAYLGLVLLAVYYAVRGEVAFWRWRDST